MYLYSVAMAVSGVICIKDRINIHRGVAIYRVPSSLFQILCVRRHDRVGLRPG